MIFRFARRVIPLGVVKFTLRRISNEQVPPHTAAGYTYVDRSGPGTRLENNTKENIAIQQARRGGSNFDSCARARPLRLVS